MGLRDSSSDGPRWPVAARRSAPRRRLGSAWAPGGAIAVVASLAVVLLVAQLTVPGGLLQIGGPSRSPGHEAGTTNSTGAGPEYAGTACNAVGTPTPSAVLIPATAPTVPLQAGGTLTAVIEFGAEAASARANASAVSAPSFFASFRLASGGAAQLYFPPVQFGAQGLGWWNGSSETESAVEPSGLTFASGNSSVLSSEKLAVTASVGYGNLTVEVRWHWVLVQPGASTTTGPWTQPTRAANWPTSTPSVFFPAPSVNLLATNGPQQTIGSNFTATLGGFVADRSFFLELEFPGTGQVVQSQGETAGASAREATVTIPMLNYDQYLSPGPYLVHIHDGCGAMLLSLPENATYASSASIPVAIAPASCGPVEFNGTAYHDGAVITTVPSSSPYPFSAPSCAGHPNRTWQFSGGLHMESGTSLLVSSSGRIAIAYS